MSTVGAQGLTRMVAATSVYAPTVENYRNDPTIPHTQWPGREDGRTLSIGLIQFSGMAVKGMPDYDILGDAKYKYIAPILRVHGGDGINGLRGKIIGPRAAKVDVVVTEAWRAQVRAILKRKGLSLEAFGETVGVKKTSLIARLNGRFSFKADEVDRINAALDKLMEN